MYLTRLQLNLRSKDVQRDLSNAYSLHQRVMSLFPDERLAAARSKYEVLFRLEGDSRGRVTLLIQSAAETNTERLPEAYLVDLHGDNPSIVNLEPLVANVAAGAVYRFRLRANASKRLRTKTEQPGKRVELVGFEALVGWFERRADAAGFTSNAGEWANSLLINEEAKVAGYKGGAKLTFGSTLFEGHLKVVDVERFKQSVKSGIGSGKAYGFGLLSIAPIHRA